MGTDTDADFKPICSLEAWIALAFFLVCLAALLLLWLLSKR